MLAVILLVTLMLFMWGAAIWASWEDDASGQSKFHNIDSNHLVGT